jgi:hypothetical protein
MTYAMFPINPTRIQDGYRKITFGEVANAVHTTAWWIDANVGKLSDKKKDGKETLVYIGPNDIRYAVLCLGSVVAGYKVRTLQTWEKEERDDEEDSTDILMLSRCSSPPPATARKPYPNSSKPLTRKPC